MFRFTLFVVGRLKNKALAQLCDDFTKRLARRGSLQIVEFKDGSLRSSPTDCERRLRPSRITKFLYWQKKAALTAHMNSLKNSNYIAENHFYLLLEALTAWNQRSSKWGIT